MPEWGFNVGRFNPYMYQHPSAEIRCLVHGDDFVGVGDPEHFKLMKEELSARFEIKTTTVGPNEKSER